MIPEYFPILTREHLLVDPENYSLEEHYKTTVGWLQNIFLDFESYGSSRKEYVEAREVFSKINKVGKANLEDWEDSTSIADQVKCMNNLRTHMGYTSLKVE